MRRRLLIAGAGTAASRNLLRSLRAADPDLYVAGRHERQLEALIAAFVADHGVSVKRIATGHTAPPNA
jgi:short-subunit dehydrogenase